MGHRLRGRYTESERKILWVFRFFWSKKIDSHFSFRSSVCTLNNRNNYCIYSQCNKWTRHFLNVLQSGHRLFSHALYCRRQWLFSLELTSILYQLIFQVLKTHGFWVSHYVLSSSWLQAACQGKQICCCCLEIPNTFFFFFWLLSCLLNLSSSTEFYLHQDFSNCWAPIPHHTFIIT